MPTITMSNQKGGTGKSTSAINLGAALAERGYRVLIADVDPQASATAGLGLDIYSIDRSIYEALLERESVEDLIVPTGFERLELLPSSVDLAGAERELEKDVGWHMVLREALAPAAARYDYVLLDPPPSLGTLMISSLVAADYFIIPIQVQVFSMHGIKQLMDTVRKVRGRLGSEVELLGALLTMVDWRTNLSRRVSRRIEETFEEKVFKSRIRTNTRLAEAPEYGQCILEYDPASRGAADYRRLAEEVDSRARA